MADTIRLNKVLRELNISIDRVAEFLESKGHTIEKRPTTKISKDLYELLCDEFQIDADKKIASKEAVEAKNKEKEEIREKQEREQKPSFPPVTDVIKASSKVVQFKKIGKIDLEPKKEVKSSINRNRITFLFFCFLDCGDIKSVIRLNLPLYHHIKL